MRLILDDIRRRMADWRPNGLTLPDDADVRRKWLPLAHGEYGAVKYAVAAVLKPKIIVEIGVGWAVAARAFLAGSPEARYSGYDDGSMDGRSLLFAAKSIPAGGDHLLFQCDSWTLEELSGCDLCHIDGGHEYETCLHDVGIALRAAKWVLVDDARDSQVAAATMAAMFDWRPGDVEWAYIPEGAGNILIKT